MSDKVAFKATLDVTAMSEELVTVFAIEHLQQRGYQITCPGQWESFAEFLKRLSIDRHESVHRSIVLWKRRGNSVLVNKTPTGRVREILSNPDFDAFARRNKS